MKARTDTADYVEPPHGAMDLIRVRGNVDDWFRASCDYCGCPVAPRNDKPLEFVDRSRHRFLFASFAGAPARDTRLRALPWVMRRGRRTLLVRNDALDKIERVIPGVHDCFRETVGTPYHELIAVRDACEPVGRPSKPLDRTLKQCPLCHGLFESARTGVEVGLSIKRPWPAFCVYLTADFHTIFLRHDTAEKVVGRLGRRVRKAFVVSARVAVDLRSVVGEERYGQHPAVTQRMAALVDRANATRNSRT